MILDTKWIQIDPTCVEASKQDIEDAGRVIRDGGLVAFPTETVYGLGGDALNASSSQKIYAAKGRPSDNPLIVHICEFEALSRIVKEIPEQAEALAKKFWPGPLTMIFRKSDEVPYETTGGLDTVAVRFPDHPVALEFIRAAGGYVAAPSANTSGRPSPTMGSHVYEDLCGKIDVLLDGGSVGIGLESTIVDLTGEEPIILRPGYVTQEMLETVLPKAVLDPTILDTPEGVRPKAPGMKYRHYAPKGDLTIVAGETESVVSFINKQIIEKQKEGFKVGVIGTTQTLSTYVPCVCKNIGSRDDEAEIAANLYDVLRSFDDEEVDFIFSEAFDTSGIGQAIMNRLLKAAGHKVVTL